jgi:hypothetical protein
MAAQIFPLCRLLPLTIVDTFFLPSGRKHRLTATIFVRPLIERGLKVMVLVWLWQAYVKSHKDFPHVSPYVKTTFRRTLTNLVTLHMTMGNNNTESSADCSLDIENSILQNAYDALKSLLLL